MSPAQYANAGLADSHLPYEILLDIDGVEDDEQSNATEIGNVTHISRRRTLWLWVKNILFINFIAASLYVSIIAYHHFYHPKVSYEEPYLYSPPACDGPIREENVTVSPFTSELHFNYVVKFNPYWSGLGWLWGGDAILSINGKDVQGNDTDVVWRLLIVNFPVPKTLKVKSCSDALHKLQGCEAKFFKQYQKHHYPYRYVDLLRRCEKEDFDVNFPSNWVDDLWRNVLYFIHEHQRWFPTTHNKAL